MVYSGQLTTRAFTAMTLYQFLLCRGALAVHVNPVPLVSKDAPFFVDYETPLEIIKTSQPWKNIGDVKLFLVATGDVGTIYPSGTVTFRTLWSIEFAHKDYTLGAEYNHAILDYMFDIMTFANTYGIQTPLPPGSAKTSDTLRRYCTPSVSLMRNIVNSLIEKGG